MGFYFLRRLKKTHFEKKKNVPTFTSRNVSSERKSFFLIRRNFGDLENLRRSKFSNVAAQKAFLDLRFRRARCPPFLPTRSRRRRRWRTSRPAPRCWEERRAVSTRRPSASSHRSLRSAAARSWEYPAAASNLLRRPQSTSSSLALKPSSSAILWTSSGRREARPTGKNIIMQGGKWLSHIQSVDAL